MNPLPERADELAALLCELSLHDDASELRLFANLCRDSLRIRSWLFGRFAREPKVQSKFRDFLRDPSIQPDGVWSAPLAAEVASRPPTVPAAGGPFGGLSEASIWALIKHYQAGRINVMSFMLVRLWRQLAAAGRRPPPALWHATLDHWGAMVTDRDGTLLRDVARAVAYFEDRPAMEYEFGAESWKIHLLFHILDHPRPCYRVGDLFGALPVKFRRARRNGNHFVERREIRKFCERHGVCRDQRAGRRPQSSGLSGRPGAAFAPTRS